MTATGSEDGFLNDIHEGDAVEKLEEFPESSVHMAMCSPPYFGLRDYGAEGQIGLEDSLDEYISELVAVGDELQRVLREDGSWWLNLGDTYGGGSIVRSDGEWTRPGDNGYEDAHTATTDSDGRRSVSKLGRKQKLQVPARVAIALQDSGWVLRNRVTWAKPNPMPQSVKDRLNETTEAVFHLTPKPDYWYDLDAVREPHAEHSLERRDRDDYNRGGKDVTGLSEHKGIADQGAHPAGKNPGDVFEVTTKPFPEAHFAVYPPELCEKPIKATCPPKVCVECGAPYEREVEIERSPGSSPNKADGNSMRDAQVDGGHQRDGHDYTRSHISSVEQLGWQSTCGCDSDNTQPGIALDPFAGAGTTCLVAKQLNRRFIGIDLNPEYVAMAQKRIGVTVDNPSILREDDETSLRAFADGGDLDE